MSESTELLLQTAHRIFTDLSTVEQVNRLEQGEWAQVLWDALEQNGLANALLPMACGGSDLDLGDGVALLKVAGYHAAPVPLAEHWLAGLALVDAGQSLPGGALTIAPPDAASGPLPGTHKRVPWGRSLPVVALGGVDGQRRLRLYPRALVIKQGANLAGEPSDELNLAGSEFSLDVTSSIDAMPWLARGALMRSAQMAGALQRCLALASAYVLERKQFGRPLAAFQAIQQELALLAAEVAAVDAAVDAAADAAQYGHSVGDALFDIAVAKARASMAVESATRIAHQVHGAMGFTYEHRLHHYTKRLWSWRDDFGTEVYWNTLLGRKALEVGGEGLWPFITRLGSTANA
ncbi:acyl-CoA dehydrogenase family protein [Nevskia sp.]|uniref:acyl-CoA dehydrogenase family protein n=1 Tax=Nevskia sp. TaxID=1929292 RepID=UPI0025CEED5E|nr:acyl-CoA dehydrogenase family protein [Nevskia sp.]